MVGDVVSRPGAGDAGSSTEDEPGVRHHVAAAPKGEALEKQADDLACIRDRAWAVCADRRIAHDTAGVRDGALLLPPVSSTPTPALARISPSWVSAFPPLPVTPSAPPAASQRIARREADTAGTAVGDDECGHDTLRVRGGSCRNENYPARKSAINLVFLTCLCGSFTSACQRGAELADRDGSA